MFQRHKWPTFEGITMIILVVISIFSFAFFTENNITGFVVKENEVTGNMVSVTGMATFNVNDRVRHKDGKEGIVTGLNDIGWLIIRWDSGNVGVFQPDYYITKIDAGTPTGLLTPYTASNGDTVWADGDGKLYQNSKGENPLQLTVDPKTGEVKNGGGEVVMRVTLSIPSTINIDTTSAPLYNSPSGVSSFYIVGDKVYNSQGKLLENYQFDSEKNTISWPEWKNAAGTASQQAGSMRVTLSIPVPAAGPTLTATKQYTVDANRNVIDPANGAIVGKADTTINPGSVAGSALQAHVSAPTAAAATKTLDQQFQAASTYLSTSATEGISAASYPYLDALPDMTDVVRIDSAILIKDVAIGQAAATATTAQLTYKTETIKLYELVKKRDDLINAINNEGLTPEQSQSKTQELISVTQQIPRQLETYKRAASTYQQAYNKYDDATYNTGRAFTDLYSDDASSRQRAINKLQQEYLNAKTDEERGKIKEGIMNAYDIDSYELYYGGGDGTKTAELTQLGSKIDEIDRGMSIAAYYSTPDSPIKYNLDGSYTQTVNGQPIKGWVFTNGRVDPTIPKPVTQEQKTAQENNINQALQNAINGYNAQHGSDTLILKEGKIYDQKGNIVSGIRTAASGQTEAISRAAPETITINGKTLQMKQGYKTEGGLAIYEDTVTGKIYTQQAVIQSTPQSISSGNLIKTTKFSDSISMEETVQIVSGKIGTDVKATSLVQVDAAGKKTSVLIDPITKENIIAALKKAGKDAVLQGDLDSGLTISDKEGTLAKQTIVRKEGDTLKIETGMVKNSAGEIKPTTIITTTLISKEFEKVSFDTNKDGKIDENDNPNGMHTAHTIDMAGPDGKFGTDDDQNAIIKYDQSKLTSTTRETIVEKIIYKKLTGEPLEAQKPDGNGGWVKDEERTTTLHDQWESRRWFANFEFHLTQFQGLSGFSQLFFDEETLAAWREGVDQIFSSLYLGTEYWASAICASYIPKDVDGVLTMKTKDNLFDIVAHVEGERTTIVHPNGSSQYLYKLTFSVRNPEGSPYDTLEFNVFLEGQRTVQLYSEPIEVDEGDSFSRNAGGTRENGQISYDEEHGKPIVKYSDYIYDKICIRFTTPIQDAERNRVSEVCNTIVEARGQPIGYQEALASGGVAVSGGSEPLVEADF